MFFLMRMAFWLGLVLVLLPTDKTPEAEKLPQIGANEAVTAAGAAVSDMSQFCVRQPAACEIGSQAATVIGHRAQAGARKVYQIITEKRRPTHRIDRGRTRRLPERTRRRRYVDAGRFENRLARPARRRSGARRRADTLTADALAGGLASTNAVARFRRRAFSYMAQMAATRHLDDDLNA